METAFPPIQAFGEIETADSTLLGSGGSSLVRMHSIGLSVRPGIIVTTDVCQKCRRRPEVLDDIWPDLVRSLEQMTQDLGLSFGYPADPHLVSVRSGATRLIAATMAGVMV